MVVLATKCYVEGEARRRALDSLDSLVDDAVGDLDVTVDVGVRDDDFPTVTVSGPDATAARNVLREQWGTVTPHPTPGEVRVGTLEHWSDEGLVLDAGRPVEIPADNLGLGPGTPAQVRTRYGLVQHLPMRFVAGEVPRLADAERDRLYDWIRGRVPAAGADADADADVATDRDSGTGPGRVNVNSATRAEVRATVNRAGHARDIVTVERLGLLEQSIVCADGTDPPGLLAAIGQYLPSELLAVVP